MLGDDENSEKEYLTEQWWGKGVGYQSVLVRIIAYTYQVLVPSQNISSFHLYLPTLSALQLCETGSIFYLVSQMRKL